ncbi:hypothetical protein BDW67DRAFT_11592 [Aspergillus spinulosporus]
MANILDGDSVDWDNSDGGESTGESASEGTQPDLDGQSDPMSSISEWADATATEAATITALDNPSASTTQAIETSTYTSSASTTSFTSDSTPTSTSIASADSDDGGGGGGISATTKIAIAVPIAVVGSAILAAIIFFLLRRRRQRQRASAPGILTRQIDTSSSAFLPSHNQIAPVPPPGPINHRPLPSNNNNLPPPPPYPRPPGTEPGAGVDSASSAAPVVGAAAGAGAAAAAGLAVTDRDLNWRTSEERAREAAARPRSPFDRPNDNDDAMSDVSEINDREAIMRDRGLRDDDDDISSVSSFGGDDHGHRQATNRGS